jgi:hypothetical protein
MNRIVQAVVLSCSLTGMAYAADPKPTAADHKAAAMDNKAAAMDNKAAGTDNKGMANTAKTEPGTNMTCGQMMASKSVLPAKMAELMTAVADSMEGHAKWAGMGKDKASKGEQQAMMKLVKSHRELAASYTKLAAEMQKGKDLPPAAHDMKAMDMGKMGEMTTRQVKAEREMAQLINKDADETEAMMKAMMAAPSGM